MPARARTEYTRHYPFGWFGILARSAPSAPELIYAHHERGFSLVSTRSPEVQRLYFQCNPDDDVANWPDDRVWEELQSRLASDDAWELAPGVIFQKGIIAMRSFVLEPIQFGNLFLAGDAAHIVPPTGAKGLNLAVADAQVLANALTEFYISHRRESLDQYSAVVLARVWRAEHFSWWMDIEAAPVRRRSIPISTSTRTAKIRNELAGGGNRFGRDLRGVAAAG